MVEVWKRGEREHSVLALSTPPPHAAPRGGICAAQVSPEGQIERGERRNAQAQQQVRLERTATDPLRSLAGHFQRSYARACEIVTRHRAHDGADGRHSLSVGPAAGDADGDDARPDQDERQDEVDEDEPQPRILASPILASPILASPMSKHAPHPVINAHLRDLTPLHLLKREETTALGPG
jgi:hypothetical protein